MENSFHVGCSKKPFDYLSDYSAQGGEGKLVTLWTGGAKPVSIGYLLGMNGYEGWRCESLVRASVVANINTNNGYIVSLRKLESRELPSTEELLSENDKCYYHI